MNRISRTRAFGVRQPFWVQHKSLPSHILRRKQGQLSWQKRPFTPGSDGRKNPQHEGHPAGHSQRRLKMTHSVRRRQTDGYHHLLSQKHGGTPQPPTTYSGHLWGDWRLASGGMSWRMFDWNVKCWIWRLLLHRGSSAGHRRVTQPSPISHTHTYKQSLLFRFFSASSGCQVHMMSLRPHWRLSQASDNHCSEPAAGSSIPKPPFALTFSQKCHRRL